MTVASFSSKGNHARRVAGAWPLAVALLGSLLAGGSLAQDEVTAGAAATGIGSAGLGDEVADPGQEDLDGVLGRGEAIPPARLRFEAHVGRREMAQGLPAQAAERFRRITEAVPGHPGGWFLLSRALAMSGDLTGARSAAEESLRRLEQAPPAIRRGFDEADFHHALGAVLVAMVQWPEAEAELRRTVALDAGHARAWFRLGDLLLQRGRDDEAAQALRQAVTLKPREPQPLLALAKALLRVDALDEAATTLERLKEVAPSEPDLHFVLASLHRARGDFDAQEADLAEFERLRAPLEERRLAGEAVDTLLREASLHLEAGRNAEAAAVLEQALADPLVVKTGFRRPRALADLARAKAGQGDVDRAVDLYVAALAERPESFIANYEVGVLLARQGHVDAALPHLLAATDVNPFHAGAHLNLGLAWGLVGRLSPALGELRKAATIDPEDLVVRQALVDLEWALGHESQARNIAGLGGVTLPTAEGPPAPPVTGATP